MSLIGILVVLVIVGVLLYLANTVLPIDGRIKTLINVIVILAVCVWLLEVFGLVAGPVFGPVHRRVC